MKSPANKGPSSSTIQLMVSVIIPSAVLLGLSSESRLGPAMAMVVALLFPVTYELYSLSQHRKPSMLSLFAIAGIIITGVISLLGLSENWLAIRRSAPYFIGALILAGSIAIKHPLIDLALVRILDMNRVRSEAARRGKEPELQRRIHASAYAFIALLLLLGISSYILTRIVITAATDTALFNSEYVRLRALSLPATSLPFFIGSIAILMFLLGGIEKLTGLAAEDLMRKKKK